MCPVYLDFQLLLKSAWKVNNLREPKQVGPKLLSITYYNDTAVETL